MSDYPDYFGVSIFPTYGSFKEHRRLITVLAINTRAAVFNLEAKCRIYGLWLEITSVSAPDGVDIISTIDGDELSAIVLDDLFTRRRGYLGGFHLKLARYNVLEEDYTIVGATDITFTNSFKLEIDNGTDGNIFFDGAIHYAKVI